MDFLGLSNLTTINNALRIIKKVNNVSIDLASLDLNDKKTYELFQRGDTTGVFQLESAGMKRYLRELKPSVFEDIDAGRDVVVICHHGGRSMQVAMFLERKGFGSVHNLMGGLEAWAGEVDPNMRRY
jgi:DNA polymerase III alpha subunit